MAATRRKRVGPNCDRLTFDVRPLKSFTAGTQRIRVTATTSGGRVAGDVTISNFQRPHVVTIRVDDRLKRCGIGTRLYEAAAQAACRAYGSPLESDTMRSGYAQAFWQKQVERGRASCVAKAPEPPAGTPFDEPIEGRGGCDFYRLRSCAVTELRAPSRRRRSRRK